VAATKPATAMCGLFGEPALSVYRGVLADITETDRATTGTRPDGPGRPRSRRPGRGVDQRSPPAAGEKTPKWLPAGSARWANVNPASLLAAGTNTFPPAASACPHARATSDTCT
jgi:hypothetical protein